MGDGRDVDYHSVSMTHETMSAPAVRHTTYPACKGSAFRAYAKKGAYRFLRCEACGLLALDPMPGEAEIAEHYRTKFHGGNYAAIRAFAGEYEAIYREYVHWMARFLRLDGARTLDVGCFTGELLRLLITEARADAYGVESSRKRLPRSRKRVFRGECFGTTSTIRPIFCRTVRSMQSP